MQECKARAKTEVYDVAGHALMYRGGMVIRSALAARIMTLDSRSMRRLRPSGCFASNGFCTASCRAHDGGQGCRVLPSASLLKCTLNTAPTAECGEPQGAITGDTLIRFVKQQ